LSTFSRIVNVPGTISGEITPASMVAISSAVSGRSGWMKQRKCIDVTSSTGVRTWCSTGSPGGAAISVMYGIKYWLMRHWK
jgi:hypothetical protein